MPHGFVHLRLHTEYSLSDSVVRVPELIAAVAAAGMPAVALTDQGNLFAMVKFYREALKAGGKPPLGVGLLGGGEGGRQPPPPPPPPFPAPARHPHPPRPPHRP